MRFLPYLLNGLCDDVPKMREVAFEAMERLVLTMCMYVHTYVCMYVCTYIRMYVCMYIHTYVCMYMYVRMHVYVYILYVYIYVCIYSASCMYISCV